MNPKQFAVTAICLGWAGALWASPRADLESPSEQTRAAAATIVRATFVVPARTNWDALVASLKVGAPTTNVQARLRARGAGATGYSLEDTAYGYRTQSYWLDDVWQLECRFNTRNHTLAARELKGGEGQVRALWVPAPTNYTGVWTLYYANGQKCHEDHYKDGKLHGTSTFYLPNGTKVGTDEYANGSPEGESVGYYRSGRLRYRGLHKPGGQSGGWTNYHEDGTIQSIVPADAAASGPVPEGQGSARSGMVSTAGFSAPLSGGQRLGGARRRWRTPGSECNR